MDAYIGVDGGSTATRAVICDGYGAVAAILTAPRVVHPLSRGGPRRLRQILDVVGRGVPSNARVVSLYLALTGVERPNDPAQRVVAEVARELWPDAVVGADTDGMAAWAGATGCQPGVAAMAGTGSVVVAVNESGRRVRTGGWGPVLGDLAGGWGIGLACIRQMLSRFDAGLAPSVFDHFVLDALGLSSPADVAGRVTSGRITRRRIVGLARLVAARADQDASAAAILGAAASALATDVAVAIQRLTWSAVPVVVVPTGNVTQAGAPYLDPFEQTVRDLSPIPVRFGKPVLSNAGGAALLALREAGLSPDGRLAQLASSCGAQRREER